MVDFTGNPYLTDPRFQLSDDQKRQYTLGSLGSALTAFGAGIAGSGAQGQPWFAGIAPGAAAASGALSQQEAQLAHMQEAAAKYQQMEDYRKSQQAHLDAEADKERRDQARKDAGFDLVKSVMSNPSPGMNYQPSPTNLGPGSYTGKVGGDESGGSYTVPNAKGSGAYGKYQFMPETWSGVAQAHPDLGLPFNMKQATPDQQEAAMQAFTADNAKSLTAAGIQPTPSNLYLAHRFGVGGAQKLVSADPNASVSSLYPAQWTAQNPDMAGKTVGQFQAGVQNRYGTLPPFQGPGAGDSQALMPQGPPPVSGAPPGMAVGDGGPPGSPAGAGPQVAQAPPPPPPQQPGSVAPDPMPQPDPRMRALAMYPEGKALAEQMQKDYHEQLEMWKFRQTEARQGRGEEMKLRQEAEKNKMDSQKMVPMGPGVMYEPATGLVHRVSPIFGNTSTPLGSPAPAPASGGEIGTPEPEVPGGPQINIPGRDEKYLKTLPSSAQTLVKAYSDGRMPVPTAAALRNPDVMQLMEAAGTYDKSFDASNYPARVKLRQSLTSGDFAKTAIAANKFINHAAAYADSYDKLGMENGFVGGDIKNPLNVAYMNRTHDPRLADIKTNLQPMLDEFAKTIGGTGKLTDMARRQYEGQLDAAKTPEETYAILNKMIDMMQGQLEPIAQQQRDIFHDQNAAPTDLIQQPTLKKLARIQAGPGGGAKAETPKGPPGADFDKYEYRPNPNAPSGYDRRLK